VEKQEVSCGGAAGARVRCSPFVGIHLMWATPVLHQVLSRVAYVVSVRFGLDEPDLARISGKADHSTSG